MASLDHPNIVPVYQAGEEHDLLYIAMRYVPGSDLGALLDRSGRLSPPEALRVLTEVSAALQAAHDAGLVHRDVKPDNVLVSGGLARTSGGRVYLTDFGLTKQLSSLTKLTAVGNVMGTMQYLAPEQINGKPVTARTDIYALGGLAYRCLTGDPPFARDDHAALLWAHLSEAPAPVSECCPKLPEAVDDVIWTAMAKEPEDRFASAAEFAEALAAALRPALRPALPSASEQLTAALIPGQTVAGTRLPDALANREPPGTEPPPGVAGPAPGGPDPAGAEPAAETGTPPPPGPVALPSPPGRKGVWAGRRMLVGVAALLVLAAGGVTGLLTLRGDGPAVDHRFRADDVAPFDVSVPDGWAQETSGIRAVWSPAAAQLLPLFTTGTAANWAAAWQQVARDPSSTVGLYEFWGGQPYDNGTPTDEALRSVLPQKADLSAQRASRQLDGRATYVREGDLSNPADPAQRLHFVCYVAQRDSRAARSEHLLFFGPAQGVDGHRHLFDRIAATVHFP